MPRLLGVPGCLFYSSFWNRVKSLFYKLTVKPISSESAAFSAGYALL